jgi:hypothetical protein
MGTLYRRIRLGLALVVLAYFVLLGANLRTEMAFRGITFRSAKAKVRALTWGFNESRVSLTDVPPEWRHGIMLGDSARLFRYRFLMNDIYVVYDKHWRVAYKIPAYE